MLLYLLLFSLQVTALPLLATSVTTVQIINSPSGPVTQTCIIALTPITDAQGNAAVREVKTCSLSSGNSPSNTASTESSSAIPSPVVTVATSLSVPAPSSFVSSPAVSVPSSVPTVPTTSVSAPTVSTISVSTSSVSVPTSAPSVPTSVALSFTPVGVQSVSSVPAPTSVGAKSNTAVPDLATPTSAAAKQASATNAAFTLPGRKLSVLPVGLGVFAGVSVIAVIVVGLVTYERTKYRKAFRQRRLAESGAAMGYGGNASVT